MNIHGQIIDLIFYFGDKVRRRIICRTNCHIYSIETVVHTVTPSYANDLLDLLSTDFSGINSDTKSIIIARRNDEISRIHPTDDINRNLSQKGDLFIVGD